MTKNSVIQLIHMKYKIWRKIFLIVSLLIIPILLNAQKIDSLRVDDGLDKDKLHKNIVDKFVDLLNIKQKAGEEIRDKFPTTRFFDLQYEQVLPTDYEKKMDGYVFEKGKLQNQQRLRVAMNVPVYKKGALTVTGSGRYSLERFDFRNINDLSSGSPQLIPNKIGYSHFFMGALSSTYFSKLFGKIAIYNVSVSADASEKVFGRITANAIATLVLKSDQNTTITAGVVGILDNRSPIPVLPIFTLDQKLGDSWELSIAIPKYIYVRRPVLANGRLTLGMSFDGSQYYINSSEYTNTYFYSQSEIKTGFMYEHSLSKKLIITLNGGALNAFGGRMSLKGKSYRHDVQRRRQDMTGYFGIGFSYNID